MRGRARLHIVVLTDEARASRAAGPGPRPRPWWRPRWYELAPEVVLAAGLTFFLVDQTDAATSAFKSTRAVVLMLATGLGWLAARLAAHRLSLPVAARLVLFGAAAAGVLAVVVVPAYRDTTVVETFPAAAPEDRVPPTTPTTHPAAAPSSSTTTTAPPVPSGPVLVRRGSFVGIDHSATGTVSIYREADGRFVVGLEEFDIQPGPDYDVYVVPGADRDGIGDGTRLDDLRGNRGTQYYDVPAGLDLGAGEWTVLVWCQTFAVPVANATPLAP